MTKGKEATCRMCGDKFMPNKRATWALYCSERCRKRAKYIAERSRLFASRCGDIEHGIRPTIQWPRVTIRTDRQREAHYAKFGGKHAYSDNVHTKSGNGIHVARPIAYSASLQSCATGLVSEM